MMMTNYQKTHSRFVLILVGAVIIYGEGGGVAAKRMFLMLKFLLTEPLIPIKKICTHPRPNISQLSHVKEKMDGVVKLQQVYLTNQTMIATLVYLFVVFTAGVALNSQQVYMK